MRRLRKTARALTLIEGIVVFLVLAVVAIVVAPSFLLRGQDAVPRSKVSRFRADARAMGTWLEGYREIHGVYPPIQAAADTSLSLKLLADAGATTAEFASPLVLPPGSEQYGVPRDPFSPGGDYPMLYATDGAHWVLSSPGPDERYEMDLAAALDELSAADFQPGISSLRVPFRRPENLNRSYDPTNGIISPGDLIHWGPQPKAPQP
ncbi:MAG: hypothetical protein RLY93_19150 [Sumerlaeia bacterium]